MQMLAHVIFLFSSSSSPKTITILVLDPTTISFPLCPEFRLTKHFASIPQIGTKNHHQTHSSSSISPLTQSTFQNPIVSDPDPTTRSV
ncbi:hypothetical protein QVD17_09363 [Tagetes erecta]|uniref:Uncharacterized protein n=1 Tax=Tagetes erecta TaxID=13708 RepID=A0AAD8P588_TARER|nr:hypothetical protein QVD17_09363 [Tagetes erecta]